jgi:hypothetical protein
VFLTHLLDVAVGCEGFLLCIRQVQGSYLGSEIDLFVLARSQIASSSFAMSVRLSAENISAPTGRIFMKVYI